MIKKYKKKNNIKKSNNIFEECNKEEESVLNNLILIGFKICKSCRLSKTIYPF